MAENEMIERVAKAICSNCPDPGQMEIMNDPWKLAIPVARAVMEAMREPTAAMVIAGRATPIFDADATNAEDAWKIMIDEALK